MKNRLVQSMLKNLLTTILICFCTLVIAQTARKAPKSKANVTQQKTTKSTKSNLSKAEKFELDGQKESATKLKKTKKSVSSVVNSNNSNQGGNTSSAAKKAERCSTMDAYNNRLQDPKYVQYLKEIKDKVNEASLNRSNIPCDASNSVTIPVAVHFDASFDCSNVQCLIDATEAQINSLNDDFDAINPDLQAYVDVLASCGGTNVASDGACLTFCLANQNHPAGSGLNDGQPAITIGQYNGGFGNGGNGAPEWPGYLNIFAAGTGAGGVADGIPGALNGDGVTVTGGVFGGPNFGPCSSGAVVDDGGGAGWDLGRTLTHEVGHYLGLYHVWGDVNGGGCGGDDMISDTPDQANPSGGCSAVCATLAACNAGEFVQYNFMDYFDDPCLVMFSNEQAIVMNTFANAVTWANDVIDLGCSDYTETSVSSCVVSAGFSPADGANLTLCADDGSPLFITDGSQLAVSWNWTFTVTSGDLVLSTTSSTMQNPSPMITGGTSGTVEVTQEACDNDGICDSVTHTYTITIASGDACPDFCDYTFTLDDTFGDTWDGAFIEVFENGTSVGIYDVPSGSQDIYIVALTDGATIDIVYTSGAFENEHIYSITDPFGNIIYTDGPFPGPGTSFTASCSPPVCDDGVQNGSEGGVDCGGASACPDCCGNGVQDDVEGGVDCGGGSPCTDCCSNGVQDDDETGIDCGGENCAPCPSCPDGFIEIVNESFDSCMLPSGWSVTSTDGGEADITFTGGAADVPGGQMPSPDFAGCIAIIDDDANDAIGIGCVVTDVINIGAYINTSLVFDWQNNDFAGTGDLTVEVYDGTMWVQVFIEEEDNFGTNETIDLSSYTNGDFQIRFCYDDEGAFAWGAGFDNVAVCGEPNDECPTTIDATDISGDYCNGSTIDLSVTNNPNVTYAWSSSSANVVIADPSSASTTATLANPQMCLAESVTISAVLTCNIDGTELFNGDVSTINVYPNPPASPDDLVNYVDCTFATPIPGCENAITLTPESDGMTYIVTFAHAGGPDCCPDVSGVTTDIVTDGSFEGGPGAGTWTEASTNFGTPICDLGGCGTGTGTGPSDGNFWAWFGGVGASEIGSVCQTIAVPAGIVSLNLSFDFEAIICDNTMDFMEVAIDGNQVYLVDGSSALCGVLGYSTQSIDLLAAGVVPGSSIELCFNSEIFGTNGAGSNFFVDNVQMLAEQPPGEDPCVGEVICNQNVPTLSQWGLIVLALLLMTFGSLRLGFRAIAFERKK